MSFVLLGTPVSDWEDGEWVDGTVINFQDGSYVALSDGKTRTTSNSTILTQRVAKDMQELKIMVEDGTGDDDAVPPDSYFAEEDGVVCVWYGEIDGFRVCELLLTPSRGTMENRNTWTTLISSTKWYRIECYAALNQKKQGNGHTPLEM